jgi:hypothetical protein
MLNAAEFEVGTWGDRTTGLGRSVIHIGGVAAEFHTGLNEKAYFCRLHKQNAVQHRMID